ncbi:pyrophosphate-fructose 6-phosphate 1-phosphotransferase beta-subunit [Coccomyxa subellipsoidea C-169]|uniref:Pyrophosphate--fructose 6-phosphate 1-phosphotransferase subunit beta n=1 Tax=Coccomyxa subellipsoidea (strain C-169) TaxID=574566 RepID=I0ZA96_COCSC|nr:pyrophosphate-fructose 6-phosphate 1-phosphotransferase beta-subunit [Coccomyxa subellipsoidea C-169]EIE27565.1 pyrophosphate-fructose 6-phosphate 1-phosphotransferase beta-subunit [Coccomyxa subellipsoidea C-169]|eukprot:XP_005652109.1 pyrophosphate-fructose 6-phosphate 1-phosphotransferase beta-subunit [Coccomyxa subellipsoidea C-169]
MALRGGAEGATAAASLRSEEPSKSSRQTGQEAAGNCLRIGIVLSGGQAAGGHNVIGGLLDYLSERHPGSQLIGFKDGPGGILKKSRMDITEDIMAEFRNTGGFHLIGSGRDKIESKEHLAVAAQVVKDLDVDGLIVCGGDDSNTNAAVLAEEFASRGLKTCVIGVPKTIDGDLKNSQVATSFGFDTACKVYAEQIGNLMMDALSAKKYYHFVRLMGRAASHITLECALQTHPQAAIICEEVHQQNKTLADIVDEIADIVAGRAEEGKNYGIVLIPEGLIEHVPQIGALISELNELLADVTTDVQIHDAVMTRLSPANLAVFEFLPASTRQQLLLDRDPHGNVQVSRIETEQLLLQLVDVELEKRRKEGKFAGKFAGITHYFGYEGRCSFPTNFDAAYCSTLGYVAGALVAGGKTGLMATASSLDKPCADWTVGGYPLIDMMCIERRRGKDKPVIKKALVELEGPVFKAFQQMRRKWAQGDCFRSPGPIQFSGPNADAANFTLALELGTTKQINIA